MLCKCYSLSMHISADDLSSLIVSPHDVSLHSEIGIESLRVHLYSSLFDLLPQLLLLETTCTVDTLTQTTIAIVRTKRIIVVHGLARPKRGVVGTVLTTVPSTTCGGLRLLQIPHEISPSKALPPSSPFRPNIPTLHSIFPLLRPCGDADPSGLQRDKDLGANGLKRVLFLVTLGCQTGGNCERGCSTVHLLRF